jgi:hypothetical protein
MCSLRAPLLILCTALILATSAVVLAQDQSPAQLSQEDSALLHNANAMTIPQLQEAIHLYQQIGNATMVGQLNNVLAQKSTRQMEDATADPSRADTPEEAPRALLPPIKTLPPKTPLRMPPSKNWQRSLPYWTTKTVEWQPPNLHSLNSKSTQNTLHQRPSFSVAGRSRN